MIPPYPYPAVAVTEENLLPLEVINIYPAQYSTTFKTALDVGIQTNARIIGSSHMMNECEQ